MDCVQVIAGVKPHILDQEASIRSNSQRMKDLQAEVNRLAKQAQDAQKRYSPSSSCFLSYQGAVLPFAVVTPGEQQSWCSLACLSSVYDVCQKGHMHCTVPFQSRECTCTLHFLLQLLFLTDAIRLGPPLCHTCDRSWQLLQIDMCM